MKKEKKKKDYAFQGQFNEKPSVIPGWPVQQPIILRLKNRPLVSLEVLKIPSVKNTKDGFDVCTECWHHAAYLACHGERITAEACMLAVKRSRYL